MELTSHFSVLNGIFVQRLSSLVTVNTLIECLLGARD